ncbi:hypothetical protein SAMN05892877_113107 [Rhizobium subbaraonis]|uniref:Uncharacterized protein n=1 Tax=Rhizobium subbaraonis TaxID=908946 RepID=A0A285USL7_9HYPH|nr:hypothetical protein SAMN05892877_113107 [Rhizobium subbaraonis]
MFHPAAPDIGMGEEVEEAPNRLTSHDSAEEQIY